MPAEFAHNSAIFLLRSIQKLPGFWLLNKLKYKDPVLKVKAMGMEFPSPIGAAAGLDKDGQIYNSLIALGFGFVEAGTSTWLPQEGNPKPRIFRIPEERSLINRMGFPNKGSINLYKSLRPEHRRGELIVGGSVSRSRNPEYGEVFNDIASSVYFLSYSADYVVINISSPNTPGLADLQKIDELRKLILQVRDKPCRKVPLLIKISPDLTEKEIVDIANLAVEMELSGIITTNTGSQRNSGSAVKEKGGLSGRLIADRSLEVLKLLRKTVGDKLTLISVGGISTVDDVYERMAAGASLVQLYTSFVYEGPGLPRKLAKGLAKRLREESLTAQQLIGSKQQ